MKQICIRSVWLINFWLFFWDLIFFLTFVLNAQSYFSIFIYNRLFPDIFNHFSVLSLFPFVSQNLDSSIFGILPFFFCSRALHKSTVRNKLNGFSSTNTNSVKCLVFMLTSVEKEMMLLVVFMETQFIKYIL